MTQRKHFKISSYIVRFNLDSAVKLADEILEKERELISYLDTIDRERYYVRYGYKSLQGFCTHRLRLTKTQSLRLINAVRRAEPTINLRIKEDKRNGIRNN